MIDLLCPLFTVCLTPDTMDYKIQESRDLGLLYADNPTL